MPKQLRQKKYYEWEQRMTCFERRCGDDDHWSAEDELEHRRYKAIEHMRSTIQEEDSESEEDSDEEEDEESEDDDRDENSDSDSDSDEEDMDNAEDKESEDGKEGSAVKLWEKQNRQVEKAIRLEEREEKARLREEKELRREEKERQREGNDRVLEQKRFDADNLDEEQHLSKYGQTYDGITEGDIECQLEIAMADHQDYRDIWFPEWPEWDELCQE